MPICQSCKDAHTRCSHTNRRENRGSCSRCKERHLKCQPAQQNVAGGTPATTSSTQPNLLRSNATLGAPATTPRVTEVHIALDLGHEFLKGAFSVKTDTSPSPQTSWMYFENVTWSNNKTTMPTEVAYVVEESSHSPPVLRPKFGRDLQRALDQGHVREEDVIRHYKPILFGENMGDSTKVNEQIRNVSSRLRRSRSLQGLPPGAPFSLENLIEDLLAYAFRYAVYCIAEAHSELDWPIFENVDDYKDWSSDHIKIEVALPLPVAASPEQISLVKEATQKAGLPNPYICGEPAAALMYHLSTKPDQAIWGNSIMILDIGAGSADFETWDIVDIHPLRVRQLCASQTRWCGARTINIKFSQLVLEKIHDQKRAILASLQTADSTTDWQKLGERLEASFEAAKKDFRGSRSDDEAYVLHIPGLPHIPALDMPGGGRLVVGADLMRESHQPQIHAISKLVRDALKEIQLRRSRGQVSSYPDELLMAGGGGNNVYVRNQMREMLKPDGISVSFASVARSENTVALGSLLLLANKELVTEKIMRRAYCVGRWERPRNRRSYPAKSREFSDVDGYEQVLMSRFFYRLGESLPRQHTACLRGWRGLLVKDVESEDGCLIEEQLYYSDTISEDLLWLHRSGLDVHAKDEPLRWTFSKVQLQEFEIKTNTAGKEYYHLDYEVALILNDDDMTFRITIPRHGCWKEGPNGCGDNPIQQTGHFDCCGDFKLINTVD